MASADDEIARLRNQLAEARADRAEQAAEDQRARIDRIERELAAAQAAADEAARQAREAADRHDLDLAVVRHDAQTAQQAAAELRLADAARRGQGRWARLRAAWRGE
jgi:hypothetical protein